jgi:hypothetical protein
MARHNLAKAVRHADERLIDVGIAQTASMEQGSMRRPLETLLDLVTSHSQSTPNHDHKNASESSQCSHRQGMNKAKTSGFRLVTDNRVISHCLPARLILQYRYGFGGYCAF